MSSRSLLMTIAGGDIPKEKVAAYCDKPLVIFLIASGVGYVRIELEDQRRLYFVFNADDTLALEAKFNSGVPLPVDYRAILIAEEAWKNAIVMTKSMKTALEAKNLLSTQPPRHVQEAMNAAEIDA